ncbi:TRAP transporter substrate-binding protein [Suttonella sp. R2A3]|uniref:TRAP transporter substrate-binding protein n=1 Tax=Suttonella sp. R2A3 TaxID=2908648 RepID=UPI001F1C9B93|nr:TRAP transporter substrate-binding protein [Suttonella sp. R2A3]UJF24972.1 TRAP transporter substrate-binding protein [Suttonella sp. R2A3]
MLKPLALSLAVAIGSAQAATTWNMASPYPDAEFHTQNIKQFVEDVAENTNGDIQITLHSGASLYKAPEIFKAVRSNQIQLGELLVSSLGNDNPIFQVDTLPFLASDYDDAQKLWAASKPYITEALKEEGAILLYTTPWPGQNFYTKEPLTDAEGLKGKKMRAYNAMTSEIAAKLDAAPTTIEVSDIAQAFSTGQIDAMITSSATGASSQAWDFVSNYTRVNAWLPKNMIFINQRTWNRLDEATQQAILDAAAAAEKRGWEMSQEKNANSEAILAENGMNVADASDALKEKLNDIGHEMAEAWSAETGEDGAAILDAYRSNQ